MAVKVGIPKGMRDFTPEVMAKRNFIFDTIKNQFQLYGFQQIETPAMENRETLTGKYGEEGDRLIFNVLNSGDYLSKINEQEYDGGEVNVPIRNHLIGDKQLRDLNHIVLNFFISHKALRYDLTVPFARYVVQHQNELTFPFKRYQIQPVWRADRPQKGRYREFYQCDADSIGSDSLLQEVEFIQLFDEVLTALGLTDFSIKINNRKILTGIAELIEMPDKIVPITVAIDKLDKIGVEKVKEELMAKGLNQAAIEKIQFLFEMSGDNSLILNELKEKLHTSEIALKGIEELEKILHFVEKTPLKNAQLQVDLTLARGLDYYTGAIFEVVSNQVKMGSICGGGRYADLTGIFGLPNLSGVGISFGADRIYDVMEELQLFPKTLTESTELLFVNFGEAEEQFALPLVQQARANGIRTELYPEADKLKKQFKYADQKQIPYIVIIGEEEMKSGLLSFKNMTDGTQEKLPLNQIIEKLKP